MLLKLQSDYTPRSIEGWISSLNTPDRVDISIATTLRNAGITGDSALLQFLVTWSKRSPSGQLVLHTQAPSTAEYHLDDLAQEDHGLIAILLAKDIRTSDRAHSVRHFGYESARRRVEAIIAGRQPTNRSLFLCADHTTKAFIPQLYEHTGLTAQPHGQRVIADMLVDHISKLAAPWKRQFGPNRYPASDNAYDIAAITYELFRNTHDWARTSYDRSKIIRSVRGIRFKLILPHSIEASTLTEAEQVYFGRLTEINRSTDRPDLVCILELSIFDAGSGLASKFTGQPISEVSLQDEYGAVLECLKLHSGSSKRWHRGVGLARVMNTLTKSRGLVWLRSGRLSLYRDFIGDPLTSGGDSALFDSINHSTNVTERPAVEGTLISMLLPLRLVTHKADK